jgi:flagellar export protein FliJ
MPFQFSLEAILRLRRGQERMERLKLEAIASELAQARRQLDFITEQFLESRRSFQLRLSGEAFGSELRFEDEKSDRVKAASRALEIRISELEQDRLKQVERYSESRRNRELVENLRERRCAVYRQAMNRREQQQIDDLFLMRHDLERKE